MEVENDVMKLDANQVHKENQINVSHMEVENDVMNRIVKQAHKENQINV